MVIAPPRNTNTNMSQEPDPVVFIRDKGWHYHATKNCWMLQNGDYERLNYYEIRISLVPPKYFPCPCTEVLKDARTASYFRNR